MRILAGEQRCRRKPMNTLNAAVKLSALADHGKLKRLIGMDT
jgi:hypothetical protein